MSVDTLNLIFHWIAADDSRNSGRGVLVCLQQVARVEYVESVCGTNYWHAIQNVEQQLIRDDGT
jgi:hypothetical protein